jgi:molybdate transport system substrate-binding protein
MSLREGMKVRLHCIKEIHFTEPDVRIYKDIYKKCGGRNSMKQFLKILATAGVLIMAVSSSPAANLTVFAAASLTDSLKEIGADYQKQSGQKVDFNFEASSVLARQIEEGAPADIFFSADETQMDRLAEKSLIDPATRHDRLGNTLVVVVPGDSVLEIHSANDLTQNDIKRIALADPKAVPAGVYARAWLKKLQLWDAVAPKVIPTENVRAALAAVASGNVDAGVVYKTDAAISKDVKVVYEVPHAGGPDIRYPMAMVKGTQQPDASKMFLKYLDSDEAAGVFRKFGFAVRNE